MHADEIITTVGLVQRLVATQFPEWSDRSIAPVPSAGTDNALYRLGDELVVRLPRVAWARGQVEKEQRWLPKLALFLPLAVPEPIAQGTPGEGYPWPWSVYRWLEGENAASAPIADARATALVLARFIMALQRIDPTGGPPPGEHNSARGEPLANRDARTRIAIAALGETLAHSNTVTDAWETALAAPAWPGPPVWIHGDLQAGNLLMTQGRLSAVIDFGCLGVGDPACDLMTAWLFLSAAVRDEFRTALAVDDATWTRARGWALSVGLIALPYYRDTNPVLAGIARRAVNEAVDDFLAHG